MCKTWWQLEEARTNDNNYGQNYATEKISFIEFYFQVMNIIFHLKINIRFTVLYNQQDI